MGHYFLLPSWICIIFHRTVVHDHRVMTLTQFHFLKVKVPSVHTQQNSASRLDPDNMSHNQGCVMTLAEGYISEMKDKVHR